jgi:hypothetical protein
LAIVYLYLVVQNLLWFVKPLKERDDYLHLQLWFEELVETCRKVVVGMIRGLWRWKMMGDDGNRSSDGSSNSPTLGEYGGGGGAVHVQNAVFQSSTRGTVRRKNFRDGTTTTSSHQEKID